MSPPTAVGNGITIHGVTDIETFTLSHPLTITGVMARRAKSVPLKAGVAAVTSSDQFKSKVSLHRLSNEGAGKNYEEHCVDPFLQAPWKPLAKRWDRKSFTSSPIVSSDGMLTRGEHTDRLSTESKARRVSCVTLQGFNRLNIMLIGH